MNLKYQSNRSHLLLLALVCLALPAAGSAAPTAKPRIFNKDKPDLSEQLFPLKYFRLDQVWGGVKGHTDGYRAKMTFKTTDGRGILAEIYFHDHVDASQPIPNPHDPNTPKPYALHFPMSALAPMLQHLRFCIRPLELRFDAAGWALQQIYDEEVLYHGSKSRRSR